jgi:AcrR family transcriptional regulator
MDQVTGTGRGAARDIGRVAARAAVRGELAQVAFDLFWRHGFDKVTVDDLAAAAGVSRSTFLRYFTGKEDAVLAAYDAQGDQVVEALRAQPADLDDWTALRGAVDVVVKHCERDPATTLTMARLVDRTPALRAGFLAKRFAWQAELTAVLAERAGPARRDAMTLSVLVTAALGCLTVANEQWVLAEGRPDLGELLDAAFAVLTPR